MLIWTLVITRNLQTDIELEEKKQNTSTNVVLDESLNRMSTRPKSSEVISPGSSPVTSQQKAKKKRPTSGSLQPKQGGGRFAKPAMSIISERTESNFSDI
jgi:hypothetical protein